MFGCLHRSGISVGPLQDPGRSASLEAKYVQQHSPGPVNANGRPTMIPAPFIPATLHAVVTRATAFHPIRAHHRVPVGAFHEGGRSRQGLENTGGELERFDVKLQGH